MTDIFGYLIFFAVLTGLALALAAYMAQVYDGRFAPLVTVEAAIYRVAGTNPARRQGWATYAAAVLAFDAVGFVLLYASLRLQGCFSLTRTASVPCPPTLPSIPLSVL